MESNGKINVGEQMRKDAQAAETLLKGSLHIPIEAGSYASDVSGHAEGPAIPGTVNGYGGSIQNQLHQHAEMLDRQYYQLSDRARDLRDRAEGLRVLAGALPSVIPEPAYRVLRDLLRISRSSL